MPFQPDDFLKHCKAAVHGSQPEQDVRTLVEEAVSQAPTVIDALGAPQRGEVQKLHVSPELTVLNVIWTPQMMIMPHNHNMWAVIGVYTGREDNIFWRRVSGDPQGRIEASGAKSLGPGDVRPLGPDVIHSVANPTGGFTGAIHVYGGDFFAVPRNEWDPEKLEEHPYDIEKNMRLFEKANRHLP